MARQRRTSLILSLLLPFFLLLATGPVDAGDLKTPVRIEIQPRVREAAVGGTIDYAVSLRNALGEAVAAPKRMTIDVHVTLPSGQTATQQVTIEPGATDGSGAFPVDEPGAIPIDASNPELMGGGVVVFGKPGIGASRGIVLPMPAQATAPAAGSVAAATVTPLPGAGADMEFHAEAAALPEAAEAAEMAETFEPDGSVAAANVTTAADVASSADIPESADAAEAIELAPAASAVLPAPPPLPGSTAAGGDAISALPAPVTATAAPEAQPAGEVLASRAPASSDGGQGRTLRLYVPEAEILADGRNGADVTVYLDPCTAMPQDVVVRLAVTRGHLDPNIVRIPRGECSASTTWRSDRLALGDATLSILVSVPQLQQGDKVVRTFVPPIHSLRLTPNPPEISLLDQGDVLAELHDDVNDVPVSTDRPMKLTLALREGNGALRPLEMTFDKGDSTARASFQPTYWGKVVVAGQIPYRLEEHAVFMVKSGIGVFLLSLVGGLIGGFLAYRAKKEKPWRILIGLVTGFALFAFFLFFGVENILEATGGLNVLNPVSVFLLSLVGGWAGTNVLAWALRRIGIEA